MIGHYVCRRTGNIIPVLYGVKQYFFAVSRAIAVRAVIKQCKGIGLRTDPRKRRIVVKREYFPAFFGAEADIFFISIFVTHGVDIGVLAVIPAISVYGVTIGAAFFSVKFRLFRISDKLVHFRRRRKRTGKHHIVRRYLAARHKIIVSPLYEIPRAVYRKKSSVIRLNKESIEALVKVAEVLLRIFAFSEMHKVTYNLLCPRKRPYRYSALGERRKAGADYVFLCKKARIVRPVNTANAVIRRIAYHIKVSFIELTFPEARHIDLRRDRRVTNPDILLTAGTVNIRIQHTAFCRIDGNFINIAETLVIGNEISRRLRRITGFGHIRGIQLYLVLARRKIQRKITKAPLSV